MKQLLARKAMQKIGKPKFKVWAMLDVDKPKTIAAWDMFGDVLLDAYNQGLASVMPAQMPERPPFDGTAFKPMGESDCYSAKTLEKYGAECFAAGRGHITKLTRQHDLTDAELEALVWGQK